MLGEGIIKGMAETARNFIGSYHDPERLTTVQVPEEKVPAKENARNFPFLVFDGSDPMQGLRCVACQICEKECPPQCIYIVKDAAKKPDYIGKPQFQAKTFDIDVSVCMSCQICVEVCPFEAIKMDTAYELSNTDRFGGLLQDKHQLAKSNDYYHKIHPTEASEVDARLAAEKAKAEAKAKADAEAKAKAAAAAAAAPQTSDATTTINSSEMIGDLIKGLFEMLWKVATDQAHPQAEFLAVFPNDRVRALVSVLLSIVPIMLVFPLLFAVTTLLERKGLGRIQNRLGPNRVGPFGIFQPIADGLKMVTKEDIVPHNADKLVHFLAPVALVIPTLLAYAVLPYGAYLVPINLDTGILFFFAVGASTELSVFMAGWSSRNKYSLLGAMRAIAQMISYEIPLILSSVTVIMLAGSLSLVEIVKHQDGFVLGFVPHWNVFTPWGLAGFIIFLVAALAESNRSPFDLPEAESEIIAGHLTEYSGFKYALFFLAEYLGMFAMCGLAATLFLGGWHAPLPGLNFVPSFVWFMAKLMALVCLFIWIRGTVPRLRVDQLLNLAWKFMLPLSLINLVVAAVWHYTAAGSLWWRWLLCAAMIGIPYVWLGSGLSRAKHLTHRIYRYAE